MPLPKPRKEIGPPDTCICPECEHEMEKESGVPCRSIECSECGATMVAKVEESRGQTYRPPKGVIEEAQALVTDGASDSVILLAAAGESLTKKAIGQLREQGIGARWATRVLGDATKPDTEERPMTLELARQAIETARAVVNGDGEMASLAEGKGVKPTKLANAMLDALEREVNKVPVGEMMMEPTVKSFDDLEAMRDAHKQASEVNDLTYDFHNLIDGVMIDPTVEDKTRAIIDLANQFTDRVAVITSNGGMEEGAVHIATTGEAMAVTRDATDEDTASLTESEAAVIESGRRAPVMIDFRVLKPGAGNKRDNHYYPAAMLKRDIHVFEGSDVFVTDHNENERSERTKVGKVLKCPVRFTEGKAPVGQVLLYDPGQAEKARNRNDAGQLNTLECSIFGSGRAKEGEIDGVTYMIVEAITEGRYLELVSKAGAGGMALSLAEAGGDDMAGKKKKEEGTQEADPVEEVDIEEAEEQETSTTPDETPAPDEADAPGEADETDAPDDDGDEDDEEPAEESALAEADVTKMLEGVRLPEAVKGMLAQGRYADEAGLKAQVDVMKEAFIASTGAGRPTATSTAAPKSTKTRSELEQEVREAQDAVNQKYLGTRRALPKETEQ